MHDKPHLYKNTITWLTVSIAVKKMNMKETILQLLQEKDHTIPELAARIGIDENNVRTYIHRLRSSGTILEVGKKGKAKIYSIQSPANQDFAQFRSDTQGNSYLEALDTVIKTTKQVAESKDSVENKQGFIFQSLEKLHFEVCELRIGYEWLWMHIRRIFEPLGESDAVKRQQLVEKLDNREEILRKEKETLKSYFARIRNNLPGSPFMGL
jgi:biotin operon repressor